VEAVTNAEGRAHAQRWIDLCKAEIKLIQRGNQNKEVWAVNRGGDAAFSLLNHLIVAYDRIIQVIDGDERTNQWKDRSD